MNLALNLLLLVCKASLLGLLLYLLVAVIREAWRRRKS